MAIDRYFPCPCGSGKKIKFCCCQDLLVELEKIQRMLEGDQRTACLEHVSALVGKYPDRAALLCVKAMLETQLEKSDEADATIARLLELHPENPIGYAELGFACGFRGDVEGAVNGLQDAMQRMSGDHMPSRIFELIGFVGEVLLRAGHIYAARAHLLLQAGIGGSQDTRALQMLMRLNRAQELPLMLKDDPDFIEPAAGAAWAEPAEVAMRQAAQGHWRLAAESFRQVVEAHPTAPDAWRNVATLEALLAHPDQAAAALRTFAQLDVGRDDAVEAIALAKLLDREDRDPTVDLVELTVNIKDLDPLIEKFSSDKRVSKMPVDPAQFPSEDGPPPRMAVWLLDREMPASGEGISREDVPNVLGELLIYGRQTDREARILMQSTRGESLVNARAGLQEVAGDLLELPGTEEVVGQAPETQVVLSWNWRMPDDTPRDLRSQLIAEQRHDVILDKWTAISFPELDGKSAAEVAGDAQYAIPLQANVLLLELSTTQAGQSFDFSELRKQLQLPEPKLVDPTDIDINQVSLPRLARLDIAKLTDEQLVLAYQRAATTMSIAALRRLATALIERDSVADGEARADACGMMAQVEEDSGKALEWLHKAQELVKSSGKSPAEFLLAEFGVRISRREVTEAEALLQKLQTDHINEPGIAQALYSMLSQLGLVQPGQMPVGASGMPPGAQPGPPMPGMAPAAGSATAEPANKLWTPGNEAAPSDKPSKLWTPD